MESKLQILKWPCCGLRCYHQGFIPEAPGAQAPSAPSSPAPPGLDLLLRHQFQLVSPSSFQPPCLIMGSIRTLTCSQTLLSRSLRQRHNERFLRCFVGFGLARVSLCPSRGTLNGCLRSQLPTVTGCIQNIRISSRPYELQAIRQIFLFTNPVKNYPCL